MNTILKIPGFQNIFFKRKLKVDIVFFIVVVALPSSFFNFIPKTIFIDLRLLYLLVGLVYIILNIQNTKKLLKIVGARWLLLLIAFLFFRFFYSITFQDIPLIEVLTIFRTNFSYPIITFGFLLYAVKMDNNRIFRFFFWLFFVTLITGFIYILSNLIGVNFYANVSKEYYSFNDTVLMQNMASLPLYSKFLFVFGIIAAVVMTKFRKYYFIFIPILVTLLSIVRSDLIVYISIVLLVFFLLNFSRFKIKSRKLLKFLLIGVITSLAAFLLFSSHIGRVINKFGLDKSSELSAETYTEKGTFRVRLNLIEEANKQISEDILLGNGYHREVKKGRYSYVVGGDTLIAPVIYTEGYLGLVLRLAPVILFLSWGLRRIRSKYVFTAFTSIVIVSLILAELLNIVQTRIFVHYNETLFIFFLLAIIDYNYNNPKPNSSGLS
ncbi:hypothetical protein [Winogradskyella sp. PE311]|uniref:hypothetical protein n=1 Tax=Winogradskyella sp. PE311 TaxID=3366943 RepID=UPI00398167C1